MEKNYPSDYERLENAIFCTGGSVITSSVMASSENLIRVCQTISETETEELKQIKTVRDIEFNVRNTIAHKPEKLTEKVFVEQCHLQPEQMLKMIKELFVSLDPEKHGNAYWNTYWKGYERMEDFLSETLDRY